MEVFKEMVKGMSDEEKAEVLKTIPTLTLIKELELRVRRLELREEAVKSLYESL